ncbi:MAG: manganese efflux pump [Clostridium sp.]|nr:manganese efflux pump [Clostridium sp.]
MDLWYIFILALALSLDAFGVSISIGINRMVYKRNKIYFAISFGFFQFLLSFLGAYLGFIFSKYVVFVPQIFAGMIVCIVGLFMIREGFLNKEDTLFLENKMYFILGISVSIDAFVVGFSALNNIQSVTEVLTKTIFIGIITFFISLIGFIFSKHLRKIDIVTKYADFIGGIMLIIIGIKMMFF